MNCSGKDRVNFALFIEIKDWTIPDLPTEYNYKYIVSTQLNAYVQAEGTKAPPWRRGPIEAPMEGAPEASKRLGVTLACGPVPCLLSYAGCDLKSLCLKPWRFVPFKWHWLKTSLDQLGVIWVISMWQAPAPSFAFRELLFNLVIM